jgi:hypothetical protein
VTTPSICGVRHDRKFFSGRWDSPEAEAARIAQAEALRDQAGKGGLRFEAYLPPDLAEWLLDIRARRFS